MKAEEKPGFLVRSGLALAASSERWFPDPLASASVSWSSSASESWRGEAGEPRDPGGKAFWSLVPFTMQMVMIIIGGYVVASAPLARRAIEALARLPRSPRGAVAWVALVSMLTSLVSWG